MKIKSRKTQIKQKNAFKPSKIAGFVRRLESVDITGI
jgi:hypothetical protein